ncbi:hypothetical protein EUTSA_v10021999mg [Eutrema salsugineum]|uniref:F-box domain-containing protein n=1 Tax=Eutrema salsugineum TaxID=72664 RepID=V4NRR5_EUTSA|nr:hypothetical protein EUTSA_v10021999mg [Eutrema salsugineum]
MRTQRQDDPEDVVAVRERNTRTKNSSEPVPFDLTFEIFSRLPAKSVARFHCLSKKWASTLRLTYFTDLFFTRSSARPQLLFACHKDRHVFFFSSSQPHIFHHEQQHSSLLAAKYQMKISNPFFSSEGFISTRGLVFLRDVRNISFLRGTKHQAPVICKPSTGQYLTLPKVKTRRRIGVNSYFGYDPVENQYKVLSMTWLVYGQVDYCGEHQLLTFGTTGEPSWKKIQCHLFYSLRSLYNQICINGVLYYPAINRSSQDYIIVCFDVRSEKFSFVREKSGTFGSERLINYNGKLGSLESQCFGGSCTSINLKVLEDAEKHEWSEHTYVLPALWKNLVGDTTARFVGVTRTNEIVLSSYYQYPHAPFYVFYYNTERNTITRFVIQGFEAFKGCYFHTFLDHVEDVRLMKEF